MRKDMVRTPKLLLTRNQKALVQWRHLLYIQGEPWTCTFKFVYKAFVCHYPLHGFSVAYVLLQSLTSPLSQTMLLCNMNHPHPYQLFQQAHHQRVAADIKLTLTILMTWIHSLWPQNITLAICCFCQHLVAHCQVQILWKLSTLTICQMIYPGLLHPRLSCNLLPQHLKATSISTGERGEQ